MRERERQTYRGADGQEYSLPEEHTCEDGWLGEDVDGRPKPCLICRDHLRRRRGPDGLTTWTAAKNPHTHRKDNTR